MPEKVACPKCGEGNYPSDRQCLSCGAALAVAAAPANAAPAAAATGAAPAVNLPARTLSGDNRSWWQRRIDDVIEHQLGAAIGLAVVVFGPALLALFGLGMAESWSAGLSAAISIALFFGVAAYCFIWYTRDPDSIWPLVLAILLSGLFWWIVIALSAFAGATIQKKMRGA